MQLFIENRLYSNIKSQYLSSLRLNSISLSKLLWLCILIQVHNAPQYYCANLLGNIEHAFLPNALSFNRNNDVIAYNHRATRDVSMERLSRRQIIGATLNNDSFSQDQSSLMPQTMPLWSSMLGSVANNQEDILDTHIKNILIPRVSGTPGNVQVRQYIVDNLRRLNYEVELDTFQASTPIGRVEFSNIIGSSNPKACRQLILACHYDSKLMDGFLGAIDSAVPCAMLLKMAETFKDSYRDNTNESKDAIGLRFVFFDGEEAFVEWTASDSLYGSRHLASKWSRQAAPSNCSRKRNELERIELLVLLDLIGASDTTFVMYGSKTRKHYESLQRYERAHMAKIGLSQFQSRREAAFKSRVMPAEVIQDDHIPFTQRNVPVLCLLAYPFPRVWHTIDDNYKAIDFDRTRRILHALESFVTDYAPTGR